MDDFFDIHTQMEHQCSLLLYMLTFSVGFIMDHIDLLEQVVLLVIRLDHVLPEANPFGEAHRAARGFEDLRHTQRAAARSVWWPV